jgi:hypothetical protein
LPAADVANHHDPGMNAHADLQSPADTLGSARRQFSDSVHDVQARANRSPRVVFVSDWVAKVHEKPVAQILSDVAVQTNDDVVARNLVGVHHLSQLLRIELSRERRGAHQITKHDGKLAALAGNGRPVTDIAALLFGVAI